jgi:hypothetical protein
MAYDYDRRIALTQTEFFEDEVASVVDTVENVQAYGRTMGQALALLRPVTECLKSKPLAKIYVDLKETLEFLPKLVGELHAIKSDFEQLDAACALEVRRVRENPVSISDVQVPKVQLRALQKRIRQYNARVAKTFDEASFSTEDIGNAGSADLRAYERLLERALSWEELNCPEGFLETDVGGLAELIHERAKE